MLVLELKRHINLTSTEPRFYRSSITTHHGVVLMSLAICPCISKISDSAQLQQTLAFLWILQYVALRIDCAAGHTAIQYPEKETCKFEVSASYLPGWCSLCWSKMPWLELHWQLAIHCSGITFF
jgi:hypothetical protein